MCFGVFVRSSLSINLFDARIVHRCEFRPNASVHNFDTKCRLESLIKHFDPEFRFTFYSFCSPSARSANLLQLGYQVFRCDPSAGGHSLFGCYSRSQSSLPPWMIQWGTHILIRPDSTQHDTFKTVTTSI